MHLHNYSFNFLISYSQDDEGQNNPPNASDSSATVTLGQPSDIQLEASDNENNQLQLTIVDQPQFGTLGEMNATTNTVPYTPNPDAIAGTDSFTYTVNDGTVDSQPATVSITLVSMPNQPPTAQAGNATIIQGTPKDIKLNATDPDADDQLVFSIVNRPINGQLGEINQENQTVSYTPNEDFTGSDIFTYQVNDGTVDSEPIQVTITVGAPPNNPPIAQAGNATIIQGTPKDIKLNATDPDADDQLVFSIVKQPTKGKLDVINNDTNIVTYTPNPDATPGTADTFTYKVSDGTADSNETTVSIHVQPTMPSQTFQAQQEIKDSDNDGIEDQIDFEPNRKSLKFSSSNKITFGSIEDLGNQTLNIRQIDENGIMIISQSNNGDYPALVNICNQYDYYIETNDAIRFECEPTNSTSQSNEGMNIE